jgi:hypothetical protein
MKFDTKPVFWGVIFQIGRRIRKDFFVHPMEVRNPSETSSIPIISTQRTSLLPARWVRKMNLPPIYRHLNGESDD